MLSIVATPIGNLKDITLRALEVLQSVDGIICEDTRRAAILLNHYNIKKPLLVLNDYNEPKMVDSMIDKLNSQDLALISDAGTPLISDPGYKLVKAALENKILVDSIPGPASPIVALILSGLPPDNFLFLGYPPEKSGHRKNWLDHLGGDPGRTPREFTRIILVSPHKLLTILQEMQDVFGDIEVVLAHELTKIHQSIEKKKISDWLEQLKSPKGEYILLFRLKGSS